MSNRIRPWLGVVAWALVGVVLATGFVVVVFRTPLLVAVGWERTGAPTTVSPSLFDLPTPAATQSHALGVGPIAPAQPAADGVMPQRQVLEDKLAGLDVAALQTGVPEGGSLTLGYQVLDIATGEVLAQARADQLLIPASNTKLLTATALLSAFPVTHTFDTTVVMPSQDKIVLVGGGDPLLASVPEEGQQERASLAQLATKTAEALKAKGLAEVSLGYDASLFQESWAPTWPESYRDQVTPISALWADEGRDANQVRSTDPARDAAAIFAQHLGDQGITVSGDPSPETGAGQELARVSSPAVHVLAEEAMLPSNNSYTEVLGMQVALKLGQPATFAGSSAAITQQLTSLGLWSDGAVIYDASGLSRDNLVPAELLARISRQLALTPSLTAVQDGMPVAGVSGSLGSRFTSELAAPGRGIARGKTGTLTGVASLAGVTVTKDGREVAFAFIVNGSADGSAAREWIDQAAAVVTGCGC